MQFLRWLLHLRRLRGVGQGLHHDDAPDGRDELVQRLGDGGGELREHQRVVHGGRGGHVVLVWEDIRLLH